MMELINIYSLTLIAVGLSSVALALIGSQISARNSAVKSLVISQSSAFGITVAVALQPFLERKLKPLIGSFLTSTGGEPSPATQPLAQPLTQSLGSTDPLLTFVLGLIVTLVVYGLSAAALRSQQGSRNTFYIGVFVLLSALTYLMTAITPTLEAHVVSSFFGDPTFILPEEAIGIGVFAAIVLIFSWVYWRPISAWSFQISTFGREPICPRLITVQRVFNALTLLLLFASVLLMGLLYTLSCLLLPTILLAGVSPSNKVFKVVLVPMAFVGSVGGFLFSLWEGTLPTAPAMTLGLVVMGVAIGATLALLTRLISSADAAESLDTPDTPRRTPRHRPQKSGGR